MRRYLTWHIDHRRGGDASQGPLYYADHDYTPGAFRILARQVPATELRVDIRDDGVSIFNLGYAELTRGETLEENAEDYPAEVAVIAEGSVISLHVVRTGEADDFTCELEVEWDEEVG